MTPFAAFTIGLWLAVAVSVPCRPYCSDEVAWLVYMRLSNAHGRLVLAAVCCSLVFAFGMVTHLATGFDPTLAKLRSPCAITPPDYRESCWRLMDDGTWIWEAAGR